MALKSLFTAEPAEHAELLSVLCALGGLRGEMLLDTHCRQSFMPSG